MKYKSVDECLSKIKDVVELMKLIDMVDKSRMSIFREIKGLMKRDMIERVVVRYKGERLEIVGYKKKNEYKI